MAGQNRSGSRKQSGKVAFCGMMVALSVALMLTGGLVPIATYCAPMLGGILLLPIMLEYGRKTAWTAYIATSLIVLTLGVAGVALATILSQTVSAIMVTVLLVKEEGAMHLDLRHLGFHKKALLQIIQIGLPAGLQSTVFSLSNVVIQSAINSFGSTVVAGNSAASNLEGFIYTGMNAFAQAAVTFTSQNVGARRYDNLDRVMRNCLLCVTVAGLFLGCGAYFGGEVLLHFYSTDEAVVAAGLSRMQIICTAYFLCGIMDTLASCLRGRGYSVIPMIVSLVGSCLLRLVWIATIFRMFRSTGTLYISYPISWALTAGVHLICLLVVRKKMNDQLKEESRVAA